MTPKRRILLIDDEEMITRVLKLSLERTGRYIVHTENSSLKAWKAIDDFQPHVIVLDVIMPDVNGPTLADQIKTKSETAHIPIIFLSGCDPRTIGNNIFLPKPISTDEIVSTIERIADNSGS